MTEQTTTPNNTTSHPPHPEALQRDGSSQAGRTKPALDPAYVAIDERSVQDLLNFTRTYAKTLRYFGATGDTLQTEGSWSAFVSDDLDLDEVVAFIQNPDAFSTEERSRYTHPHFVLLLTFLQLLGYTQDQLNQLTHRHLDFYYQHILQVVKRSGIPDQVHVLLDLTTDTPQSLLPAGTLLNAGTDSQGQDLFYATDQDIVINQAQVAKLRSIHVDKRVIGIPEAQHAYDEPKSDAFMRMMQVTLGHPAPGDDLPTYPTGEIVDYPYLQAMFTLIIFVQTNLYMTFPEFRTLIQFKQQRDKADSQWNTINALLEKAGQQRTENPDFQLNPTDLRDFETNLELALGGAPNFDGLTEVENVYDAYEQRIRESVQQFIQTDLYFTDVTDFYQMMRIKIRIDSEWGEINRILEEAGQTKRQANPPYTLPVSDPTAFEANLKSALGTLTYPTLTGLNAITDLDAYHAAFVTVEQYLFNTAEDITYYMAVAEQWISGPENEQPTPLKWEKVYTILAEAHKAKVYADRRTELQQIREEDDFDAMMTYAVGGEQTQSGLTSLQILSEYITSADDIAFLEDISQRQASGGRVTTQEWTKTYRIVELAQRVQLPEPVAQQEEWLNLYPAEDATAISVNLDVATDTDTPRWKTFGENQGTVSIGSPAPPEFGWAISSPLLTLREGQRTITLTLGFNSEEFKTDIIAALFPTPDPTDPMPKNDGPFRIQISTAKGWIEADTVTTTIGDYQTLSGITGEAEATFQAIRFVLTFAPNIDPLATLPGSETQFDTPWPILRLMLKQMWQPNLSKPELGRYITHYQPFQSLVLLRTHLVVAAAEIRPWQLQNDNGVLKPKSPFDPFGSNAAEGARFYLAHPELATKKLDSLTFNLEWMGGPSNLTTYYQNYPAVNGANIGDFTAKISMVDTRMDLPLAADAPLFTGGNASTTHTIAIPDVPQAVEDGRPGYPYARTTQLVTDSDLSNWNRYFKWELNGPDFQHSLYPTLAAQKSLELTAAIANNQEVTAADYQVNSPYTPKIKQLSLNYSASVEITLADYTAATPLDHIFHIQPFGLNDVEPQTQTGRYLFLPQYPYQGELYIGIQTLHPPQNLSLLFQMAEGSANPDLEPFPIEWFYLSGNRWCSLAHGQVLQDTTRGFINTGIISFSLPVAQPNTLLSPDLYWLRAAIPQNSDGVCDTVAIHTQAVSATFADHNNAPDHLSCPLPAETISGLAQTQAQFKGVRQPYTSYGGKMPEGDKTFYTRLSERLRHKRRAITIWDYEHLILERFPQVYKAKCLPAKVDAAGQVELIVIPDIKNKLPFNPFEPKAPADLIADIEGYLTANAPPFVTIKVKNAHYVAVKTRFAVRFLPGYNEGYYKQQLNEAINHFLSPWAYEEGGDIVIGGRIYANVIINFIEEQPYVDYVAQMKLFSSPDGHTFKLAQPAGNEGYWVEADKPDMVLVAARQHEIDIISDAGYEAQDFNGLNYMKIELDFVVS